MGIPLSVIFHLCRKSLFYQFRIDRRRRFNKKKECEKLESLKGTIDYKKLYEDRYPILRKAYERSNISKNPDYQQFLAENEWWLSDYALFMAVKDRFEGRPWTEVGRRYPPSLWLCYGLLPERTVFRYRIPEIPAVYIL